MRKIFTHCLAEGGVTLALDILKTEIVSRLVMYLATRWTAPAQAAKSTPNPVLAKLVQAWADARNLYGMGRITRQDYQRRISRAVFAAGGLDEVQVKAAIDDCCRALGLDECNRLIQQDVRAAINRWCTDITDRWATQMVPSGLRATLVWHPGWDGMGNPQRFTALSYDRLQTPRLGVVKPDSALAFLLEWTGVGVEELLAAARTWGTEDANELQAAMAACHFETDLYQRSSTPARVDAAALAGMIDESTNGVMPTVCANVDVRALLQSDPDQPMEWSAKQGLAFGLYDGFESGRGVVQPMAGLKQLRIEPRAVGFTSCANYEQPWGVLVESVVRNGQNVSSRTQSAS